jgi:ribosome-associated toxin RatA of RatAB toxin-antitoxin module
MCEKNPPNSRVSKRVQTAVGRLIPSYCSPSYCTVAAQLAYYLFISSLTMPTSPMTSETDVTQFDAIAANSASATYDLSELTETDDFESIALETDDEILGEVEVCTERLEGRRRKISARVQIPASVEQVWQVLTDYNRLADFIPNLASSQRIAHPQNGIRVEQIGSQAFLRLKFCARVVLDMVEQFPNRIGFQMVEGDFKEFSGSWEIQASTSTPAITELCYTIVVVPALVMPVSVIEKKLKQGLSVNLVAVRDRVQSLA